MLSKIDLLLLERGVTKREEAGRIFLKKGGRVFSFVKEEDPVDNEIKILGSLDYFSNPHGQFDQSSTSDPHSLGNFQIEEKIFPSNSSWRYITCRYRGESIKIPYPYGSREKFIFDLLFLDAHMDGYLQEYVPKKGDVAVDAGAYHGLAGVVLSKIVGPNGRVLCLEPDEKNLPALEKTLEINNCKNTVVVQKALWNKKDRLEFSSLGNCSSTIFDEALIFDPMLASAGSTIEHVSKNCSVEAVSLVELAQEHNLKKIDFVKMDIEGAELEALEGCLGLMETQNIHFAIASYHLRDGIETSYKLEDMFRAAGYYAKTSYPRHTTTYASKPKTSTKPNKNSKQI